MREVYDHHSVLVDYPGGSIEPLVQSILSLPKGAYFGAFLQFVEDPRLAVVKDFRDAVLTDFRLAFQPDSEIRELFAHRLSKMRQSGSLGKVANRWIFNERPESDLSHRIFVAEARQIGLENLYLPASLLVASAAAAAALAWIERLAARGRRERDKT